MGDKIKSGYITTSVRGGISGRKDNITTTISRGRRNGEEMKSGYAGSAILGVHM